MHLLSVMSAYKNPCPLSLSISKKQKDPKIQVGGGSSSNSQLQDNIKGGSVINSSTTSNKRMMFSFNVISPLIAAALVLLSPLGDTPVSFGQQINIQKVTVLKRRNNRHLKSNCSSPLPFLVNSDALQFLQGATLFLKDLQRNNITTEEDIYKITYYGNGRMPGFGEKCTPRGQCTFGARLADDEIKLLAEYVKTQADLGWATVKAEANGD